MQYYGWINLKEGPKKYIAVVKIDGHDAYGFNKLTKEWIHNNDNLCVKYDTTSWDEISEDEALNTIRQLSGDDSLCL